MKAQSDKPLAGVILAGGASTRMGAPKAIMPWGNRTFLQAVSDKMRAAGVAPLFVVLGANYREVREHCRSCGALPIHHESWSRGQFSSLRVGVSRAPHFASEFYFGASKPALVTGVMVAFIDQPHIQQEVFCEIAGVSRQFPDKLIIPSCKGRRGHPFIIPCPLWPALKVMPVSATTREFLRTYETEQLLVPVSDDGIHFDLDTPEDLLLAKARYQI